MKSKSKLLLAVAIASALSIPGYYYGFVDNQFSEQYTPLMDERINEKTKEINFDLLNYNKDAYTKNITFTEPGAKTIRATLYGRDLPKNTIIRVQNRDKSESYTYAVENKEFSTVSLSGDTLHLTLQLPKNPLISGRNAQIKVAKLHHQEPNSNQFDDRAIGISGDDERQHLECLDKNSAPYAKSYSAVRAFLHKGDHLSVGSGSLLGKSELILTNAHVAKNMRTVGSEIWFNYQNDRCVDNKTIHFNLKNTIKIQPEKLVMIAGGDPEGQGQNDVALIGLNKFDTKYGLNRIFGGLRVSESNNVNMINEPIYIPQFGRLDYPGGDTPPPVLVGNRKHNDDCRINEVAVNGDNRFFCDVTPGSSGSPLISKNSNEIIGLTWGASQNTGGNRNFGVKLDYVWKHIAPHYDLKDNVAIASKPYNVVHMEKNISENNLEGSIYTYDYPVTFTVDDLVSSTHKDQSSFLFFDKKEIGQQNVTHDHANALELWVENNCGQTSIDKELSCATPGKSTLKYKLNINSLVDQIPEIRKEFWLPLVANKKNVPESALLIKFTETLDDPFTPPFDINTAIVENITLNAEAVNRVTFDGVEKMGFVGFNDTQAPTGLVNNQGEIKPIPVTMKNRLDGSLYSVKFRVTRTVPNCDIETALNSVVSCDDGTNQATLNISYLPEANQKLPKGEYEGILPLQLKAWGNQDNGQFLKNILYKIKLDFDADLPFVAEAKADPARLIGTGTVKLSATPSGNDFTYQWQQIDSYPKVTLNNPNQANASVQLGAINDERKYRFQVTVTNKATNESRKAEVLVTQIPDQDLPLEVRATASPSEIIGAGQSTLSAVASNHHGTLTYEWRVLQGPGVTLSNKNAQQAQATFPEVTVPTTHIFSVTVTDSAVPAMPAVTQVQVTQKPKVVGGVEEWQPKAYTQGNRVCYEKGLFEAKWYAGPNNKPDLNGPTSSSQPGWAGQPWLLIEKNSASCQ